MIQILPPCSDDVRLELGIEPGTLWIGERWTAEQRAEIMEDKFGTMRWNRRPRHWKKGTITDGNYDNI